jgi:toxin ParE1/3/4
MKIQWLSSAKQDLQQLRHYIATDNPQAAQQVALTIIGCINLLAEQPAIGRKGRLVETRELIVPGTAYIIPYRIKNDCVEILRVYHSSRKWTEEI